MPVIPVLSLPDADAACRMLAEVFGFVADGGLMRLGDQVIAVEAGSAAGHGVIDHLAIAVPDLGIASRDLLARGARPDATVTPDGPLDIPEFWDGGVRYLFLEGPAGARIEVISNLAAPQGPGHDHIGIPCTDILATSAFLTSLGASPRAAFTLKREEGTTEVRFLSLQGSVLELYQPPRPTGTTGPGLWHCLRVTGARPATGPDGLTICPA